MRFIRSTSRVWFDFPSFSRFLPLSLPLCFLLLSSCSLRTIAIREVTDLVVDAVPAFERDDDPDLIREALPANIKLLEAMLESDPKNFELLTLLTQLYGSYTFGFVEPELDQARTPRTALVKARVNQLYLRGISYGERALRLKESACDKGLDNASELDNCLAQLSKAELGALFWYGFNLAAYINRNLNSVEALAKGVNVEKSMARVVALDESFLFGCSHVLLMAYYGSRSPMMGGNPEKAEAHYKKAKEISQGQFWLADVFYARYVLVQNDDQAAFEKLLKSIEALPLTAPKNPRVTLYNSLAKQRARLYLTHAEEFF